MANKPYRPLYIGDHDRECKSLSLEAEGYLSQLQDRPNGHPECSGVYAVVVQTKTNYHILGKERIIYIGSSTNISKRILSPRHPYVLAYNRFKGNMVVFVKSMPTKNYKEVERVLIRLVKPLLNKTHKK